MLTNRLFAYGVEIFRCLYIACRYWALLGIFSISNSINPATDMKDIVEKLKSIQPSDSAVVCVVCEAGWSDSIENVKHQWLKLVETHSPDTPIMVIINDKTPSSVDRGKAVLDSEFKDVEDLHPVRVDVTLNLFILFY